MEKRKALGLLKGVIKTRKKKKKWKEKNVENLSFLEKLSSMLFYIVQLFFKSKQDGCQDTFTRCSILVKH